MDPAQIQMTLYVGLTLTFERHRWPLPNWGSSNPKIGTSLFWYGWMPGSRTEILKLTNA